MLASKGLITCPCPVPVSLISNRPSSITPTLIHFPISLRIVPSLTLFSIISMRTSDDRVEVSRNICFQNGRDRPLTNHPANLVQRILWSATRPESVGTVQKILLIDRIKQIGCRFLHDLVFQRRYRDRPLPSVLF